MHFDMAESNSRRLKVPEELAYLLAILLMVFGVCLTVLGDLGVSMVVAPAYILSEYIGISFGTTEYIVQAALLVVLSLLLRRFRISYLVSFLTAFVYGIVLDLFLPLFSRLPADTLPLRLLWFVLGAGVTAVAVAIFFRIYPSPQAYDLFVREASAGFGISQGRFKLTYDVGSAAVAILLSFVFFGFGVFHGIGVGTVVLAFVNGPVIGAVGRLLDRTVCFYPLLPIKKYFC